MSTSLALWAVVVLAVVTYAQRGVLILVLAGRTLPPLVERALRNVAPAVLAALVVTMVADPAAPSVGLELAEVVGLVAAGLATWRWRNHVVSLVAGMLVFWAVLAVS